MELIEIIRNSLIIFTIISSIFLGLSYTVYKLKDRKRIKPYEREENFVPPAVLLQGNEPVAQQTYETGKMSSRFRVLNDEMRNIKEPAGNRSSVPVQKVRQNHVISYYSFNKNESMHKLRPSREEI
jgi:hypothetical protein